MEREYMNDNMILTVNKKAKDILDMYILVEGFEKAYLPNKLFLLVLKYQNLFVITFTPKRLQFPKLNT